jgi:hypothetical protein
MGQLLAGEMKRAESPGAKTAENIIDRSQYSRDSRDSSQNPIGWK